jgi:hypothetical protein
MVADRRVKARSMQVEAMLGRALKSGRRIDCRKKERSPDAIEAQAGFTDDSFFTAKKKAHCASHYKFISAAGACGKAPWVN